LDFFFLKKIPFDKLKCNPFFFLFFFGLSGSENFSPRRKEKKRKKPLPKLINFEDSISKKNILKIFQKIFVFSFAKKISLRKIKIKKKILCPSCQVTSAMKTPLTWFVPCSLFRPLFRQKLGGARLLCSSFRPIFRQNSGVLLPCLRDFRPLLRRIRGFRALFEGLPSAACAKLGASRAVFE
jgi:hypothetical protein